MQELQQPISEPPDNTPKAISPLKTFWSWLRLVIVLGVIFLVIHNLFGLDRVSGNSMNPTLANGNVLFINKLAMLFESPKYGDVVVIDSTALGYNIVKRVIAVGGDRIAINDGTIYVNGEPLTELYTYGKSEDMAEILVEPGHVFVAGDNRDLGESLDSRDPKLGQVDQSEIKGFVACSLWPMHGIAKPLKL
ncbi:signal peptidase I [Paenibacillus rhizovicinus]|uniref:Signal peptidase I n=1 Tax=Paenibacillus rhizovicinus TaxID=2704463 RepID=A0A6C0P1E5_9BACL|nr:signal peptidase I [Paenibacillus rhizovicinus]QHW32298.1 signal peptidase I [Paenibacillus rhizovicinus]